MSWYQRRFRGIGIPDFSFSRSNPHEHKNPASRLGFSLNSSTCNNSRDQIRNRSMPLHWLRFLRSISLPVSSLPLRGGRRFVDLSLSTTHLTPRRNASAARAVAETMAPPRNRPGESMASSQVSTSRSSRARMGARCCEMAPRLPLRM